MSKNNNTNKIAGVILAVILLAYLLGVIFAPQMASCVREWRDEQ